MEMCLFFKALVALIVLAVRKLTIYRALSRAPKSWIPLDVFPIVNAQIFMISPFLPLFIRKLKILLRK
jgi:hypothetical protein